MPLSSKVANSGCFSKLSLEKKVIQRYITMHPRLEAGKDLQKIMYSLISTTQTIFTKKTSICIQKFEVPLEGINTYLPYLFTYKNQKNIKIDNTTNAIDGGVFSPMKKLLKIHNGFSKSLKLKMVDDYLVTYKKK
ncbi:MAG: hypothetical protein L3J19_08635 [Sulfurimonas sp.]|nr:hypothetical protein [Sulfurimonas sp.]